MCIRKIIFLGKGGGLEGQKADQYNWTLTNEIFYF